MDKKVKRRHLVSAFGVALGLLAGCAHADPLAKSRQSSVGTKASTDTQADAIDLKQVDELALSLRQSPPPGFAGAWPETPQSSKGRISTPGTYALIVALKNGGSEEQRRAVLARADAAMHPYVYFYTVKRDKQEQDAGLARIEEVLVPLHKAKGMSFAIGYDVIYDRFEVDVDPERMKDEAEAAIPDDLKADTYVTIFERVTVGSHASASY